MVHKPDPSKSRSNYLQLLELECQEPGHTVRHLFWLAREYTYYEQWKLAITTLDKVLASDVWVVERAHSLILRGQAYAAIGDHDRALVNYLEACSTTPGQRETWMALASYQQSRKQWAQAYSAVSQALGITSRPEHYLAKTDCWNEQPYDVAALCAFKLGINEKAREHIRVALKMKPGDSQLLHSARVVGYKTEEE